MNIRVTLHKWQSANAAEKAVSMVKWSPAASNCTIFKVPGVLKGKGVRVLLMLTLLWTVVISYAPTVHAQTSYCVRSGATGSNNGSDWNNAYSSLPSTLIRGATYYIADGSYSGRTFNDIESGSTLITIKKATITDHGTNTGWSDSYGDGQATFGTFIMQRGYYLIDGARRNENNWKDDASYGFRIKQIYGQNSSYPPGGNYITVQYASIGDNYSETYYSGMSEAVYCGGFAGSFHHWTISRCFVHNSTKTIFQFAGVYNHTVEYCFIGPGWGKEAIRGQINAYNLVIRHNTFYNATQKDPEDSTSGITAEIAIWDGSNFNNNAVYGNTFFNSKSGGRNGVIVIGGNGSSWVGPGTTGSAAYNNTFTGIAEDTVFGEILLNGSGNSAINNLAYNNAGSFNVSASTVSNNITASSNPFVDYSGGNYRLSAPTAAGYFLSSPYNADRDGKIRGGDGNFDVGAFEFVSGSADVTPPVISNVQATGVSTNSATVTWATNEASSSWVDYGSTTSYGAASNDGSFVTAHSIALTGLSADTTYHYRVRSIDAAGNSSSSSDLTFRTVALPTDTTAPTVTLSAPSAGSTVSSTVTLTAAASDNIGGTGVGSVLFYVDGSLVATVTASPYSTSWNSTSVADGSHVLKAVARDGAGNEGSSANITVTVVNAAPSSDTVAPTVSLSAPVQGATVTGTVAVSATASDNSGGTGVGSVSFYVDGNLVGSDSTSPYSVSWDSNSVAEGSHVLKATARDIAGNQGTSSNVTVTVQKSTADLNSGLVGYWALDEASGTVAVDSSGNGNNGSLFNGPSHVEGKLGKALNFDGIDDRVDAGTFSVAGDKLTLCAWVNAKEIGADQRIIAKATGTALAEQSWLLEVEGVSPYRVGIRVNGGGSTSRLLGGSLELNTWVHVAGVYDGTTLRVFKNGVEVANQAKSGTLPVGTAPVWIGDNPTVSGRQFNGSIDDVRVYNRALSTAEIQTLYSLTPLPAPSLFQMSNN